MKKHSQSILSILLACLCFAACEKAVFEEEEKPRQSDDWKGVELTFNIAQFEQMDFSGLNVASRAASIGEVCSRINLAIYQDGTRVTSVNQKAGDGNFGSIKLTLAPGSYELLVLAHSCDGNATTTNLNKITFPSNKVTDTFLYYAPLTVSGKEELSLTLKRVVAMFRLKIEDEMPSSVKRMKFYYTGGSSTLDGASGFGCVNSKQTEYRDVTSAMVGQPTQFEVFTLPHAETGELKMNIQALDAADNVMKELTIENVPVTMNKITLFSGTFFNSSGGSGGGSSGTNSAMGFTLSAEDEWEGTQTYSY